MIRFRSFLLASSMVALAGCIPLAGSYVHLEAPGIRYVQGVCRDIGPPAIAAWEREGLRFEMILQPLFESSREGSYIRVRARKGVDVHPAETQGRLYRGEGASRKELRFGLKIREGSRPVYASALGPTDTTWYTFAFTGLPPIDGPGRVELPAMVVGDRTIAMPVFEFDVRPWATLAPLNC